MKWLFKTIGIDTATVGEFSLGMVATGGSTLNLQNIITLSLIS